MFRKKIIPISLSLMILLAGCGTPAPVAEPAPAPAVQETDPGDNTDDPAEADAIPELLPADAGASASGTGGGSAGEELPDVPLKDLYAYQFRMGVAVQAIDNFNDPTAEIGNPDKEALIRQEFNSMTFGNEWKPAYNFDPDSPTLYKTNPAAEELLTWAKENGIPVRGHTLVWHSQCNPAIFAKDFKALSGGKPAKDWNSVLDPECLVDASTLVKRLRTYIRGVMEYTYSAGFADTVYAFDVINEAVEEKNADGLRNSYYYQIIGPEFLYYCFLFAREAELDYAREYASLYGLDPDKDDLSPILPKLFYNDYNEWFPRRTDIIRRFLTEDVYNAGGKLIKSDAIKEGGDGTIVGDGLIDGIGMQGHLDDTQNIDQYIKALEAYDAIVDEVQITELDVGETSAGEQGEQKQAEFVGTFFRRLLEERAAGINLTAVTWWGLTDDASWRKGANPLLYHGDLSAKPAYKALQLAARGETYDASDTSGVRDASPLFYDFEPRSEGGKLVNSEPVDMGINSRGSGHQAALEFVPDENHTEGAPIGRSLLVTREEGDATVRIDISRFIGNTIEVSLWVKTGDASVTLGAAGDTELALTTVSSNGDWMELTAACRLDEGLSSAALYLETDGSADMYIDDVSVEAQ